MEKVPSGNEKNELIEKIGELNRKWDEQKQKEMDLIAEIRTAEGEKKEALLAQLMEATEKADATYQELLDLIKG